MTTTYALARTPRSVLVLCLLCMTLEGYDVIAYGAVLPALLADRELALSEVEAGLLGSLTPIGMLFGAMAIGLTTDIVGRRKLVLVSVTTFSAAMLLCAVAPGIALFGLGRFAVGLGAGGVLPTIAALVYEYSPAHRRNFKNALAFAGVGAGGALAALVAVLLVPSAGFRAEFLVGGAAALVVLPTVIWGLPESLAFLKARERPEEARRWMERLGLDADSVTERAADSPVLARKGIGRLAVLVSRPYRTTTVMFCLTTFVSLLILFGLLTWLPVLMRQAGYPLGSALTFLLVLNLGTALGPLLIGKVADRIGSRRAILATFALSAAGIAALSRPMPMVLLYVAVVLAGMGTIGTQLLLNVFIASRYPVEIRATALGTALSVGRFGGITGPMYGSALLGMALSPSWNFYGFAAPALLGIAFVALVPREEAPKIQRSVVS